MAKKGTTKPVEKPVKDIKPVEKGTTKPVGLVEEVPFKSVVEIDVSKPKTLDFEEGTKDAKILLKCFGNEKIQLGKGTDGNVIICKNETHAVLQFSEIWHLMSTCKV